MANRIAELESGSLGAAGGSPLEPVRPTSPAGSTTASPDSSGNSADQVHITGSARALAALSQAVQQTPEIDHARVNSIQRALDSGHYQSNPQRIAARMLQLEQDLGGTHQ